ncbi:MAG: AAA family ATPase, partial [Deltaproteobacteria bacterium]|nr:AAA family ATPase [Deltaproteobacteria bacterium]
TEGSLAYVSPEQTGRMNREVDYRTDFYSLGVTLYVLFTGELPFPSTDLVELVHAHIARPPTPPGRKRSGLPSALSAIIVKLLAKNAQDRYRSAAGISRDLVRVEEALARGHEASFEPGRDDLSDQFLIPQQLYGREAELAALHEAFERAASGRPELLLVSGYPGIGKTALVHELQGPTVVRHGFFAVGKFDMLSQSIPYSGFVQALRDLVDQVLTESASIVTGLNDGLQQALGDQTQVLVDLIPNLHLLVGPQRPAAPVDAATAERRLRELLTRLVHVFTAGGRPLVVFLDDLQWADAASIALLQHLASHGESRSLLLLGTYRDNESGPGHPLTLALADLRKSDAVVTEMALSALPAEAVDQLVADTLHERSARVDALAVLLRDKTGGNPFFLRQFFAGLHEAGQIAWEADQQRWSWDPRALQSRDHTDNVVEMMVGRLRKLPERTRRALELAACIGNRFEVAVLGRVMDQSVEQTGEDLWDAVQLGLLRGSNAPEDDADYRFVHDRVLEAAYVLVDEPARQRAHLRIGRLLWASGRHLEDLQFDICRHFNLCLPLLDDPQERSRLVDVELAAGRRAKASTAYAAARAYLQAGLTLAGKDDAWEHDDERAFALHRELAECEYLAGDFEAAADRFDKLLDRAQTDLAKVEIFTLQTLLAYHRVKYEDSLATARAGLATLGFEVPDIGDGEALGALAAAEGQALATALEGKTIAELVDLPTMTDARALAEAELLNELSLVGMFLEPQLSGIGAIRRVRLSIEKGNSRVSAPAYGAHGMVVGSALGDYASGYEFGKMAVELSRRQGDRRAECQALFWFAAFSNHWRAPVEDSIELLKSGVDHGLRIGAPVWASYNAFFVPVHTLVSGARLDEVEDAIERYMPLMEASAQAGNRGYLQLVRSLTGRTPVPGSLSDDGFDEDIFVEEHNTPGLVLSLKHYYVAALAGLVLFGRTTEAVELVESSLVTGDPAAVLFGQVVNAWWLLFQGVATYDWLADAGADHPEAEARRTAADACLERLTSFASNAPDNFEPMSNLLWAERARTNGDQLGAMDGYDRALASARGRNAVHIEAIANERAGRFHVSQGRDNVATGYLREAVHRYAMWGATAKVQQLRAEFPDAVADTGMEEDDADALLRDPRGIDLASVLKASRVLTSEIDLQRLLETTLAIVLENAGAERGVLLIAEDEELRVEAAGRLDGPRAEISTFADNPIPLESADDLPVCVGICQYVERTRDTIVLDDAHARGRMAGNPYLSANKVRSVLCVPLVHQGRLFGVIYLENNLADGAFTPGRVETVKLISSQSVIAIQNARLYADLNRHSQDLERINKSMSRFVPSEFLSCLGKDSLLDVGLGQNVSKNMSILFSDIRGFTTLIESLPTREHIEFINEYLQYMGPPIATNRGFVDSYIGDGIMALFETNPDQALQAGIDMSAELRELNSKRAVRGEAPVNMGVGVNSGPLTLGTIGGPTRIKCGVIGDSVNLASRIQDLTKRYEVFLLASESSVSTLSDRSRYTCRVVGRVTVVGRHRPTTLYEVVDAEMRLPVRDAKLETLPTYERAVDAFYRASFEEAASKLDKCLEACPQDVPASLYRAECDYFQRMGVPNDWRGVIRLEHKG